MTNPSRFAICAPEKENILADNAPSGDIMANRIKQTQVMERLNPERINSATKANAAGSLWSIMPNNNCCPPSSCW